MALLAPYLAMAKYRIISPVMHLWPVKFKRVLVPVNVHVCPKFHQAKCSGSRVIVVPAKSNRKI